MSCASEKDNSLIQLANILTKGYRLPENHPEIFTGNEGRFMAQGKCGIGVLNVECENPKKEGDPTKDLYKQFRELLPYREKLAERNLTENEVRHCLKIIKKYSLYLTVQMPDGTQRGFHGRKKGLERYNKKMSANIRDCISEMVNRGYECFFVTTTFDPGFNGGDRADAWMNYYADFMHIFKDLVKHKGVKICWVLESTGKGYPHIHAIVGYPKGTYKNYDKLPRNRKLKYGELVDICKKAYSFKIFDVKVPSDNGIKWYLTKYITKTTTHDIFQMIEQEEPLSKEQLKTAYALIYTTMARKRMFAICRFTKNENPQQSENSQGGNLSEKDIEVVENLAQAEVVARSGQSLGRLRPFLRKLCTNFPCQSPKKVFSSNIFKAEKLTEGRIWNKDGLLPEDYKKLNEKGTKLTCGGCFYSHLVNFVLTDEDDFINIIVRDENGKKTRYFKPEDFENDDMYIAKIKSLIQVYTRFALDTGGRLTKEWIDPEERRKCFKHSDPLVIDREEQEEARRLETILKYNHKSVDTIPF